MAGKLQALTAENDRSRFLVEDKSLADSDNLPPPEVNAQEIVDDLEAALEQSRLIAGDWGPGLAAP